MKYNSLLLFLIISVLVGCKPATRTSEIATEVSEVNKKDWKYIKMVESPDVPIPPLDTHTNFLALNKGTSYADPDIVNLAIKELIKEFGGAIKASLEGYNFQKMVNELSFHRTAYLSLPFNNKKMKAKGKVTFHFLPIFLPETEKRKNIRQYSGTKLYYSRGDLCFRIHATAIQNGTSLQTIAIYTPPCGTISYLRDYLKEGLK